MAKIKKFSSGIDSIISNTQNRSNISSSENIEGNRFIVNTSIDIPQEIIKQFKIAIVINNLKIFNYFDHEINKIVDNNISIPILDKSMLNKKYSLKLYGDTKNKLKLFCIKNDIAIRDVFLYIMSSIKEG